MTGPPAASPPAGQDEAAALIRRLHEMQAAAPGQPGLGQAQKQVVEKFRGFEAEVVEVPGAIDGGDIHLSQSLGFSTIPRPRLGSTAMSKLPSVMMIRSRFLASSTGPLR
ncbi:hypothetical protein [uncultured Thiohalocapsa sp.]|uniref:hypothetical protein n=1 Tax=uncultured Thiohalocapsa sp. TaxID=768990 RepID=UPI0025F69B3F|nr:hypothetical protein [uncultured Thiohalocapsa sp.]